jgi:hypothetical protein
MLPAVILRKKSSCKTNTETMPTSNNTDVMGYRPYIGLFWTANDGINMTSFTKLFKATNCVTTTSTAAQEIKTKNKQINT